MTAKTINIHGKEYTPVSERVRMAHEGEKLQGVKTEVLQHEPVVVVQATVNISGVEYQGISAANPSKTIEKTNPYEVAETSAVGRALGFAGYGIEEAIASADEVKKAVESQSSAPKQASQFDEGFTREPVINPNECEHPEFWENTAKTEANMGRKFKTCKSCKKFLGWIDTKELVRPENLPKSEVTEEDLVNF